MERLFEELMEAWRYTRDGVVAEVENLPDAAFTSLPEGLGRTALDLANHISPATARSRRSAPSTR